jgi:hypothetical protein
MHLAQGVDEAVGRRIVEVPLMPGVDEDMRNWSFYMILEHNTIVNRAITASMRQLARAESLHDEARIDPKHDVLPSLDPGVEQVGLFAQSIKDHLTTVKTLPSLRGTATSPHPLFGEFDATFGIVCLPSTLNCTFTKPRWCCKRNKLEL